MINFPEMAAARAALKLGSFVKDEAICSIKNWWKSGLSAGAGNTLAAAAVMGNDGLGLGSVKSRVMVGPAEVLRVVRAEVGAKEHLK
nr:hypothetical protein Iba_chr03bCG2090 [Ipomoea batatas]